MTQYEQTALDPRKVRLLIKFLYHVCSGPSEAFALMCASHLELNEVSFIDNPEDRPDLEGLISEIGMAIRSVKEIQLQ